ncbi:M-phase phosphoprotein 8 isoform X2 [Oryzias melastigma]|uniref:M-phase phosphoprotein 8 isoform X2 n=1 Tax=Oryzias melastigma TaxID=30732 RepID=UPI000CF813F3|nr:M-phase phosphoprotein 8 isoform X2 [Oryzias melastigma]
MAAETNKVEPADSEQDEEEDVYEVERIIDMRVEEGEVLYRVRWKNYCSDDDTWEPEAHLEDCREVLLTFKKHLTEAKAKKESEKPLPSKSELFDADSESDSDKDRPTDAPIKKKKKKKKIQDEDEETQLKEKKKKKKDKRREELKPLPAPDTDDEEESVLTPPAFTKEKKTVLKKRVADSDEEDESLPFKKHKKDKEKGEGKQKREKLEEGKKKKGKKERKIETSEDEITAPLADDLSEGPSESQLEEPASTETSTKAFDKTAAEEKSKLKKGKCEVRLQGIKDFVQDRKNKKPESTLKEGTLQKIKNLTSKSKDDNAPQSDSSDGSTLHKKSKSKGSESSSIQPKVPSSSTSSSSSSSSVTAAATPKTKEEETSKEDMLGQKDASGSTNLFEKFLLNCEAKDRAPRRPPTSSAEKSTSKPTKLIGKIEKNPKASKEPLSQKAEPEKTERTKQSEVSRPGQSYGFSLDSDERDEEFTGKSRPGDDSRERKDRSEEPQRPAWEKRTPADDRRRRAEDSEPRLYSACDETQDPAEGTDRTDKSQATLSLGMDLNLDWMTLDDFQKHLNGEDEILSGPPLSPSELRDAVKSGDYMAVKLALNSKEDYNLEQEDCAIGERKAFEGEKSSTEEQGSSDALTFTSNLDCARKEDVASEAKENISLDLGVPQNINSMPSCSEQSMKKSNENNQTGSNAKYKAENLPSTHESQEKNDPKTVEEKSFGVLSTNKCWTKEDKEIIRKEDDGREEDTTDKEMSPGAANKLDEKAEHVIIGKSCGTNQEFSQSGKEGIKKPSLRPRKTMQIQQPTRTSLRTRKKVLYTKPSKAKKEKGRSWKKHVCLYCKMAFKQLAKHLEQKHSEETDVSNAIRLPKGSKVRQKLLDQIRNKGNFELPHVLEDDKEEIVPKMHLEKPISSVRDFLPCQFCFALYRNTDLWRHERSCKVSKEVKSSENSKTTKEKEFASGLLPVSDFLTETCNEIINVMHQDEISRHIRTDPLICKYGNALSVKYANDKSQFSYIAQKMRELGRFVLAVNELDKSVKYLHEVCLPSRFELAVEGVKRVGGFDPSSSKFKTISLVTKIGYSLKRAAEIAFGESRMTEDRKTEDEVKTFIQLLDTKWNESFSRKVIIQSVKQEVKKVEIDKSTVTEDLVKLHKFITSEQDSATKDLKESPSMSTWKKLCEATLADVCLFNRGRVGNIGRLLLQTYAQRKIKGTFIPSADQVRKITKLEEALGSTFTRLELEGQYGRNMLVLLTDRMASSLDLLVESRDQAGVSKTNPYLFARTEGPSFIRGLDCFRRSAVECGVKNPEALLSSSLRDQVATCWQLMSLRESELDDVSKIVGRSSQECHILSQNTSQLEELSKLLLKMDRTRPSSPANTTKEGTGRKPLKRRPWSEKEQAAVKHYLSEFISSMKVPGKKECNACIAAEPDLEQRSWTDVKNYIHNTLQTLRRRKNQQKPDKTVDVSNPKSPKAAVQNTNEVTEETSIFTMTTVNPDQLSESPNCCIAVSLPNLRESLPFSHDMTSSYSSMCSTNIDMLHTNQSLLSSFTPLNSTDNQVVPTFTPHNTTDSLMSVYAPENGGSLSMSSLYTQNTSCLLPPPLYSPHDITHSPMIPSFTTFNPPSTSMVPTYTDLNVSSASMPINSFSTLNDRCRPFVSPFTSLNHSNTPAYPTNPHRTPTVAQVVPSIHTPCASDSTLVVQENKQMCSPESQVNPTVKTQKRSKRLWNEDEQAAVKRQLGDFSKLVKVPGKKDCDACLAAEPALSTRTWREVKYFVHNSIQSLKRRGHDIASKPSTPQEPDTQIDTDWDGPVYLSL